MKKVERILARRLRPILLHVINEKKYDDKDSLIKDINEIKSISYNDISFIEDESIRQGIILLISIVSSHIDEEDNDNSLLLKYLIEDTNIFKVYNFIENLYKKYGELNNKNEMMNEIDSYLDRKSSNKYLSISKRFENLLLAADKNDRSINEESVSLRDLESIVMNDIDEVMDLSTECNNYRIDDINRLKNSLFHSNSIKGKSIVDKLNKILNEDSLSPLDKINLIKCEVSSSENLNSELSMNIRYLLSRTILGVLPCEDQINFISKLINKY